MKKTAALLMFLAACGGPQVVGYKQLCDRVECYDIDDSEFIERDGTKTFTCRWDCVVHEGRQSVNVEITWWSVDGACYELVSEHVYNAVCGYPSPGF